MRRSDLERVVAGLAAFGLLAWAGLHLYTRPLSEARSADPVRALLSAALVRDSAALMRLAGDPQPASWALAAVMADSTAVAEWSRNHGRVRSAVRAETLWVTLFRNRSTPTCPQYASLTAALVGDGKPDKVVRMAASCPGVH